MGYSLESNGTIYSLICSGFLKPLLFQSMFFPILFSCVLSCRILSCPVISCHVMSCHVLSCHVMSCHVMSCHVLSCLVMSFHFLVWPGPSRQVGKVLSYTPLICCFVQFFYRFLLSFRRIWYRFCKEKIFC